ncbi:hypothetical protein SAMN05421858_1637 [Haladaptatus litoreus]|uniref:Uncharacterized protein n=1 Tax=Haladaptatus litoreus TaxID=553468 RepID=A0A1N6YMI0_9EURY|nr:hypothetical protein [Haladaptatus litoreus]SIR15756.1 hypothetical protein SAMN05421858_1637 [Haladaptatus litoreus]
MNKHFKDAWYYFRRSGSHLRRGVQAELDTGERKFRTWTGREQESEPEPTRREKVRKNLRNAEQTAKQRSQKVKRRSREAKRRSRDAVKDARKRIGMS